MSGELERLQRALFYWMPSIAADGTPEGERAAEDATLLFGFECDDGECWGDDILKSLAQAEDECDKLRADLAAAQAEVAAWKLAFHEAYEDIEPVTREAALNFIERRVAELLAKEGGK